MWCDRGVTVTKLLTIESDLLASYYDTVLTADRLATTIPLYHYWPNGQMVSCQHLMVKQNMDLGKNEFKSLFENPANTNGQWQYPAGSHN